MTHAFELDNLTKPDSGAHPGATVFTAALAVAQERGLSGRELLTAFVAGTEATIRIGHATKHTQRGARLSCARHHRPVRRRRRGRPAHELRCREDDQCARHRRLVLRAACSSSPMPATARW